MDVYAYEISVKFDKETTGIGGKKINNIGMLERLKFLPPGVPRADDLSDFQVGLDEFFSVSDARKSSS